MHDRFSKPAAPILVYLLKYLYAHLLLHKESEAIKKIHEEHGHCDDHDFTDSVIYIDKRIGEYDEPPQIEAKVKPVYEFSSQETQERKSPSKSKRERDGWDR